MKQNTEAAIETREPPADRELVTRGRAKLFVLLAATLVCFYFVYRLTAPFLPAIVWAVAAAVITKPVMRWLERIVPWPTLRAGFGVMLVAVVLVIPAAWLAYVAAGEVGKATERWNQFQSQALDRIPGFSRLRTWATDNLDLAASSQQVAEQVSQRALRIVQGSVYTLLQTLLMLFVLFYLYRDEPKVLAAVEKFSPLSLIETRQMLTRLSDTIRATILGTVFVSIIQGVLGGLIFWILGLPAPVFWGVVMGLLAVVPYLGAFVVWAPAAAFLAVEGSFGKALVLTAWGTIVVGLVDNLVYPMLVGNRLRQHTVIAFFAIIGGLTVFGATGIVLGPVLVSLTLFLLETWRRRTRVPQVGHYEI